MNYAKLSEQIASGSKINSLMDDSVQAINIISSNRKLNQIGTWIQNVQVLRAFQVWGLCLALKQ